MRLATLNDGTPDGRLALISQDGARVLEVGPEWPNLLGAIESWEDALPDLRDVERRLADGEGRSFTAKELSAPLPRTWQWLDGSAYATHAHLMQIAYQTDPLDLERPLMYQGMSNRFLGPCEDVPVPDEALGIDFEGEFGVIVDHVPMGTGAAEAAGHIKLLVQINDWSLRAVAPAEMKTGFGWLHSKPACSVAPFAITPDELGDDWRDGRVCLDLHVDWNGKNFGRAAGEPMLFNFPQLIAHAAATRDLVAGTMIGSGTVSNDDYAEVGSSCISERRAIEMIANGAPQTPFMRFGDTVRMEARTAAGHAPFGSIEQRVVKA